MVILEKIWQIQTRLSSLHMHVFFKQHILSQNGYHWLWRFPKIGVPLKSSILIGPMAVGNLHNYHILAQGPGNAMLGPLTSRTSREDTVDLLGFCCAETQEMMGLLYNDWLVVDLPLWKRLVKWEYYSQYMET